MNVNNENPEDINQSFNEEQDFENSFEVEHLGDGSQDEGWFKFDKEENIEDVAEEVIKTEEEVIEDDVVTEQPETIEDDFEVKDLDEATAFEFLKKSKGLDVESFDDLLKPKESRKLSPEVEKFLEFSDKTGNTNYNDFLATQKDWSVESKDTVIKEYLKIENPTLSEKQIDFLYNKDYNYDEDIDDEDEVMLKSINVERDFQKGVKLLDARKEEFMVRKGLDETIPEEYRNAKTEFERIKQREEDVDKLISENRNDFLTKVDSFFNDKFDGFKVKIGEEELPIRPENIQEVKKQHSDLSNFNDKYFDKVTGKLTDPDGFHKALYFGMNADKMAEHFYNLGKATLAEQEDRLSKNIQTDTKKPIGGALGGKISVRVLN